MFDPAIPATKQALTAALAALGAAYKQSTDPRVEALITDLYDTLNERLSDLDNIVEQIESDRRPWFSAYAAGV